MGYRNIMGINKDEGDETNNMMWMWYWLGYIEIDKGILWEWRWGWYFEETKSTMGIMGILGGPTVTPMDQATYCSFAFRKPKGQRGHLSLGTPQSHLVDGCDGGLIPVAERPYDGVCVLDVFWKLSWGGQAEGRTNVWSHHLIICAASLRPRKFVIV